MYGFDEICLELNVSNILSKVSDEVLWRYYLGIEFELKKNYASPLRKGDNDPSFNLYLDRRGRIMFKDFGGQGSHGDIFEFLQLRDFLDFRQALVRVNVDFKLGLGNSQDQAYKGSKPMGVRMNKTLEKFKDDFAIQTAPLINAYTRGWRNEDYAYWLQYGVTKENLQRYNVHCIKQIRINGVLVYTETSNNPCYGYYFPSSKHIKCYFPFATGRQPRFLGNVNNYQDIQGYYQCNVKKDINNKLLILTKSMKDVMCLREMGYEAMAIHGEGQHFYKDFIRHIKKYYPKIISMYDRDKTGVKGMLYLWRHYGISALFIPKSMSSQGIKDIADMYKILGKERTEDFMNVNTQYVANQATVKDQ